MAKAPKSTSKAAQAAVRGAERAAAVAAGEYHLWRPKARRFADKAKQADRQACRGKVRADD